LAVPVILGTLYLPQSWYFFMDYPWNDYRLHWLRLLPGLPAFVPTVLLPLPNELTLFLGSAATTLILGIGLLLACRRSVPLFMVCATLVFVLSVVSAFVAHGAFRA
jgi:hypothetical protein